ncbi:MAG: arylsulfatase A-like enzyme [Maribacter sp.]|jgi:arylsulfatase A-like enzyme
MNIRFLILLSIVLFTFSCKKDVIDIIDMFPEEPNILLIIADDMGKDATPGYTEGSTKPNMPHLESMMTDGIVFDNFWTNPICAPTRAGILTGKYGVHTNVLNADDMAAISLEEESIQSRLDAETNNAYTHAVIGKWHLSNQSNGGSDNPNMMGIDYYAGSLQGAVSDYNEWSLTINGNTEPSTEYTTTKYTDLAIDWISEQNQPWFCWMAYNTPHTPFHVPPAGTHSQGDLLDDETEIDNNPAPYYMAMMENMDHEMGRLLSSIPSNELENTIIIFVGDNGTTRKVLQSPYANYQSKGSLYNGGVNTPFIISGTPVTRKNVRDNSLINNTDIFATILGFAGANVDKINNSVNYSNIISTEENQRDYLYTDITQDTDDASGWTIRNSTYKLNNWYDGTQALFNLIDDPYESDDLLEGTLSTIEQSAKNELESEAASIRQ